MSLGRLFLLFSLLLSASSFAQEKTPKASTSKAKKVTSKVYAPFAIGVSYMLWNEDLKISQAGESAKGFANYGGYGLSLEKSWMQGRWLRGGTLALGFGKTTSGGFNAIPTFVDGVNRAWQSAQLSVTGYYRINTTFMFGLGAFARYRNADWKPLDPTLTVDSGSKFQYGPQFLLRWRVNNTFSFIQAYTLLNFKNSNMWTWTAQIDL